MVNMITYNMEGFLWQCVERYCELAEKNGYNAKLKTVSTPFLDDGCLRAAAECRLDGGAKEGCLREDASKCLMKILYCARMARFDLLRPTCALASNITRWTEADDKALHRLVCYINSTLKVRMIGFVGDDPSGIIVRLSADADFAGCHETRKSSSGVFKCLIGQRTFFPITGRYCKQTAVSHSTPEAELIAADFAVRVEGIPCLDLWDTLLGKKNSLRFEEDNDATFKIIKKGRSPALGHVKRTHGVCLRWLFDICATPDVAIQYCRSEYQSADIFTKNFTDARAFGHALMMIGHYFPNGPSRFIVAPPKIKKEAASSGSDGATKSKKTKKKKRVKGDKINSTNAKVAVAASCPRSNFCSSLLRSSHLDQRSLPLRDSCQGSSSIELYNMAPKGLWSCAEGLMKLAKPGGQIEQNEINIAHDIRSDYGIGKQIITKTSGSTTVPSSNKGGSSTAPSGSKGGSTTAPSDEDIQLMSGISGSCNVPKLVAFFEDIKTDKRATQSKYINMCSPNDFQRALDRFINQSLRAILMITDKSLLNDVDDLDRSSADNLYCYVIDSYGFRNTRAGLLRHHIGFLRSISSIDEDVVRAFSRIVDRISAPPAPKVLDPQMKWMFLADSALSFSTEGSSKQKKTPEKWWKHNKGYRGCDPLPGTGDKRIDRPEISWEVQGGEGLASMTEFLKNDSTEYNFMVVHFTGNDFYGTKSKTKLIDHNGVAIKQQESPIGCFPANLFEYMVEFATALSNHPAKAKMVINCGFGYRWGDTTGRFDHYAKVFAMILRLHSVIVVLGMENCYGHGLLKPFKGKPFDFHFSASDDNFKNIIKSHYEHVLALGYLKLDDEWYNSFRLVLGKAQLYDVLDDTKDIIEELLDRIEDTCGTTSVPSGSSSSAPASLYDADFDWCQGPLNLALVHFHLLEKDSLPEWFETLFMDLFSMPTYILGGIAHRLKKGNLDDWELERGIMFGDAFDSPLAWITEI